MKLLSRDPLSRTKPLPRSNRDRPQELHPSFYIAAGYEGVVPDASGVYSDWTSMTLPLDATYIDPAQRSWGQNLGERGSLISTTANYNNNVLSGGPYSTPHFRLSSSSVAGHTRRRSSLSDSASLPRSYSNAPSPPESVATHVEHIVPRAGEKPEAILDGFPLNADFELDKFSEGNSTDAPPTGILDRPDIGPGGGILSRKPLTLRDRIHKLGQEMKTSAATSVSKFPSPIPLPLGSLSTSTSFSQVLDSTLTQCFNHRQSVNIEDKSRGIEGDGGLTATVVEEAQDSLHSERIALQRQRQQRRFQNSARFGAP